MKALHKHRLPRVDEATDSGQTRHQHNSGLHAVFDRFASKFTRWTGSPLAFGAAVAAVVIWALSGPAFGYSETWQLVINTGTTIVTFLMVFLIQQSQNKDSHALHLKLDGLLCALEEADNRLVDIEDLDEEEIAKLAESYHALAEKARAIHESRKGGRAA